MKTYRFIQVDVFTDRPFGGNQLAVFSEPAGLDAETMQAITREMAYSESTFVFPKEDPRPSTAARGALSDVEGREACGQGGTEVSPPWPGPQQTPGLRLLGWMKRSGTMGRGNN